MNGKALLKIISVFILCVLFMTDIVESKESKALSYRSSGPDINIAHLENKIHDLVNKERAKRGLPALMKNERLHTVAIKYSQEMSQRNFFSHNDPDGRCFYDRYRAEGFACSIRTGNTTCMGAENIAQVILYSSSFFKDGNTFFNWNTEDKIAETVVKLWMSSKGHKANILTPYFKQHGIGIAFADDGKAYITEDFC